VWDRQSCLSYLSLVVIAPLTPATLTNMATISGTTPDPVSSNNASAAVITVVTNADLSVVTTPAARPLTAPGEGRHSSRTYFTGTFTQ